MRRLIVALGLVVVLIFSFSAFGAEQKSEIKKETKQSQELLDSYEITLQKFSKEIEIYAKEIVPHDREVNVKEIKTIIEMIWSFWEKKKAADKNLKKYSLKTATVIFDTELEKVLVGNRKEEIRRKFVGLTGRYLKIKPPIVWPLFWMGILLFLVGIGGGFVGNKATRIIWVPMVIFTGTVLFISAFHWIQTEEIIYPSFPQGVFKSVEPLEKSSEEVESEEPEATKPD